MNSNNRGALRRTRWLIVAVFITIVALQLAVTAFSIEVLSAVRAYVNGESLYSKAQKDAHERLIAYIQGHAGTRFVTFAELADDFNRRFPRQS